MQPAVTYEDDVVHTDPPRRRRRSLLFLAIVIVAMGAAIVFSTGFGRDPTVVESVLLDEPAPRLAGATLDGGTFDLAEHTGSVAVVNVWASWCGPCRREHPLLVQAAKRLEPLGVTFVGINTQDTNADAKRFLDELGGESYPSVTDPKGRLAVEWGTFGVPETFIVDRDGRLRAKRIGEIRPGWIEATVAPLLEER